MSEKKRPAIMHYALPHNVLQPAEGTPNHYSGWAPHYHDYKNPEKDTAKFEAWKKELFGNDERYVEGGPPWGGGLMETLLWDLADAGIKVNYAVDQWAGVMTEGKIKGEVWTTFIECDSILLGLMESWRWWFKENKVDKGGPGL